MQKDKTYASTFFGPRVLRQMLNSFDEMLATLKNQQDGEKRDWKDYRTWEVTLEDETWHYDNMDEFLAKYPLARKCHLNVTVTAWEPTEKFTLSLIISENPLRTKIFVGAPRREQIEQVFAIVEEHAKDSYRADAGQDSSETNSPRIFIGHGNSPIWKELKDHLQDKHRYRVEAYETSARSGHAIRDILEQMASTSAFALLVFTGEDEVGDGELRARQNVVHELGLFQGKLGFGRAIVLIEKGVETFTNIDGLQYIEFSPGNIKETYGDVLAVIRREFEKDDL